MSGMITGTPVWVWPLFVLLVVIGLRSRHERKVPIALFYALPLLGISALIAVTELTAGPLIWVIFGLAYTVGAWAGYIVQRRWLLGRERNMVCLAGENLTLIVMMTVFGANFVGGFLAAVAPQIYSGELFRITFTVAVAMSSGSFAGRALRVWRGLDATAIDPRR